MKEGEERDEGKKVQEGIAAASWDDERGEGREPVRGRRSLRHGRGSGESEGVI